MVSYLFDQFDTNDVNIAQCIHDSRFAFGYSMNMIRRLVGVVVFIYTAHRREWYDGMRRKLVIIDDYFSDLLIYLVIMCSPD